MGFWVGVKLLLVVKLKIDGVVIYGWCFQVLDDKNGHLKSSKATFPHGSTWKMEKCQSNDDMHCTGLLHLKDTLQEMPKKARVRS